MSEVQLQGIIDSTLREGAQSPGMAFSREQKLDLVSHLCAVGIEEIELGVASPAASGLPSLVREAATIGGSRKSRIALWCRCCPEDIRFARFCAPDVLSLSMPVSDIHLGKKLRLNRIGALQKLSEAVAQALDIGVPYVSVGLEDATRADEDFLLKVVELLSLSGASRLRLADTVGIASPAMVGELIGRVRGETSLPVGFHGHNDFGMATANGIAALEAGAAWVDATVLGLGERAGNCRLEELVGYLSLCRQVDRYHPERLHSLCQIAAEAARTAIPGCHPIVGKNIFTCESGLHVHGMTCDPRTYEPYDPELLGRTRSFLFGSKTGRGAVRNSLARFGYRLGENDVAELVKHVRQQAEENRSATDVAGLVLLAKEKGLIRE